jgi:rRNA-processing protein FCF1
MKQVSHKIMSLLMAFVVFFSTMSFTVDMHYCGDTLVETAIFHKAKGCGMEMQNTSSKDCSIIIKDCCNDEQVVVYGQDELQLIVDKITFEQHVFITSFINTYVNLFEGIEENVTSYRDYIPPLVIKQIYKLDATYLI